MVIVMAPARQHLAGMSEAVEHLLIEAFIAQFSIEAFNEAVLLRLARRDVVPGDAGLVLPFQGRPANRLPRGACVHARRVGLGSLDEQECPAHTCLRLTWILGQTGADRRVFYAVVSPYLILIAIMPAIWVRACISVLSVSAIAAIPTDRTRRPVGVLPGLPPR